MTAARPLRLALFLLVVCAPCLQAEDAAAPDLAPVPAANPADLGRGLHYDRVGDLNQAPQSGVLDTLATKGGLVVDLRRTQADASASASLAAALLRIASLANPVFVLLGPDTPAAVIAALPSSPHIVSFAAASAGLAPTVAVKVDADRDRAACDALATGQLPAGLIEEKLEKRRFDEERLANHHAGSNGFHDEDVGDTTRTPAADAAGTPAAKTDTKKEPEPVRDLVLQRAIFLHRALLALGRLSEPIPSSTESPPRS